MAKKTEEKKRPSFVVEKMRHVQHPRWLLNAPINPTDERVWLRLWDLYQIGMRKGNPWIRIGVPQLAKDTRLNVHTVDLSIRRLKAHKLIETQETGRAAIFTLALEHDYYRDTSAPKHPLKTTEQLRRKSKGTDKNYGAEPLKTTEPLRETDVRETERSETSSSDADSSPSACCSPTEEEVTDVTEANEEVATLPDAQCAGESFAIAQPSPITDSTTDRLSPEAFGAADCVTERGDSAPLVHQPLSTVATTMDAASLLALCPPGYQEHVKGEAKRLLAMRGYAPVASVIAFWRANPDSPRGLGLSKTAARGFNLGALLQEYVWAELSPAAEKAKVLAEQGAEDDRRAAERAAQQHEEQRQLDEQRAAERKRIADNNAKKLAALPSSPEVDAARALAKVYLQSSGKQAEVERAGAAPWLELHRHGVTPKALKDKIELYCFNHRGMAHPGIEDLQTWSWQPEPTQPGSKVSVDEFADRFLQAARDRGEAWVLELDAKRVAA